MNALPTTIHRKHQSCKTISNPVGKTIFDSLPHHHQSICKSTIGNTSKQPTTVVKNHLQTKSVITTFVDVWSMGRGRNWGSYRLSHSQCSFFLFFLWKLNWNIVFCSDKIHCHPVTTSCKLYFLAKEYIQCFHCLLACFKGKRTGLSFTLYLYFFV